MSVLNRLRRWVDRLARRSRTTRTSVLVAVHLGIFSVAYLAAFAFRFDFQIPAQLQGPMWEALPLLLAIKVTVFAAFKMFQGWWKYVSLYDVIALAQALAVASLIFLGVHFLVVRPELFPRSIYLLDFTLSLVLLAGARGSLRLVREAMSAAGDDGPTKNLMIVGADDLGDMLVREITRGDRLRYRPVAFLDDDAARRGLRIHGIPVDGPISRLEEIVEARGVEEIIIALGPGETDKVREIVERAGNCGIQPMILPAVETVLDDEISLRNVRDVSITDLLGRDPVDLDVETMGEFLEDQVVVVTGAAGSIGGELCRQVLKFSPARLVMVDCAETPLFGIRRELSADHAETIAPEIADVTDRSRIAQVFEDHRPDVVLHAAAYKHVPLMEANPAEAVKNNVAGTRVVADLAAEQGVGTFVLISTDKAVNPTSVMGATKRITERYIHRLGDDCDESRFCAVRFGNVLGSNGSVVPIFRQQIRQGGPVTVTHPDMTRYFMTIPEAAQLVLQAASFESDDDLFILDMGSPIKIADLARDMIRLSGMTEDQIPIVFTGMRPGEKLYEELTLDEEAVDTTSHEKIFVGRRGQVAISDFDEQFDSLVEAAQVGDDRRVRQLLEGLIPGYGSDPSDGSIVDFNAARAAR